MQLSAPSSSARTRQTLSLASIVAKAAASSEEQPKVIGPSMIDPPATKEAQYSELFEAKQKHGITRLGLMVNQVWNEDPKRTLFTLARYKFVARMLAGRKHVLEVGCADAFGTRIVQQAVGKVTAVDFDPLFIEDVKGRMDPHWPLDAFVHDMLSGPVPGRFDAAYA